MKKLTDFLMLPGRNNISVSKDKVKVVGSKPKTAAKTHEIRQRDYLSLFQLMRDHRMLRLKVHGDSHVYQTVLLEVNVEEGFLVIDEPFPFDGILSGNLRQNVVLEYQRQGFTTVITSVVEMRIEEGGDQYFRLEWPKIEVLQRRDQFRLGIPQNLVDEVSLTGFNGLKLESVLDMSASGIRIAFEGDQMESVYAGAYLQNICLCLHGCAPIMLNLDITHCHYVPDADLGKVKMTVAGGRLVGLTYRERQVIERFIFSAQRSQRRNELAREEIAA